MNPLDLFSPEVRAAIERLVDERVDERLADVERESWPAAMTIETAATYTDSPVERLRKLVARRAIPFVQEAPGCAIRFLRRDLDEWMREQRVERKRS